MSEPMSDIEIREMEAEVACCQSIEAFLRDAGDDVDALRRALRNLIPVHDVYMPRAVAEIRRLRRENHLLALSRGSSLVGMD